LNLTPQKKEAKAVIASAEKFIEKATAISDIGIRGA